MGRFVYNEAIRTEIDDRTLMHLQSVMVTKLRRRESFAFTFKDQSGIDDARTAVWIHPNSRLVFTFHGSRIPPLNSAWLEALAAVANSARGLHLVPEPTVRRRAVAGAASPDAEPPVFTERPESAWPPPPSEENRVSMRAESR